MKHQAEMAAILKQVELLTPEERLWLSRQIADEARIDSERPQRSFGDMIGFANPSGRSLTEQDVDDLRFEALAEKHLR